MARPNMLNRVTGVAAAAQKYGVPVGVLWGVYGAETAWGGNVKTSSAGAQGDFQFIPSTARSYRYPLTNDPTPAQWQQQADAAAHYLSDLYKKTGSWDAALKSYSGGGYGVDHIRDVLKKSPQEGGFIQLSTSDIPIVGPVVQGAKDAAGAAADVGQAVGRVADLLTSSAFWIRLGEAVLGIALLLMGLRSLTGTPTTPLSVARAVAR